LAETVDAELAVDRSRLARGLASTTGLRGTGDLTPALSPADAYQELVASWLAFLASLGRTGPVVVVVEDIHWADPTMLDVLDELAERLEGPVLFVCTARPDLLRERPDWGGGRRGFSSLPLEPLATADSAQLVSLLLDDDPLTEGVARRVLERSEGNPFFVEEVVRHLVDQGLLVRRGERWHARDAIDRVATPDTVQGVILARLDLLSAEEKRVAQRAAVVGRTFWEGAVSTLADVDDIEACLRTLRRREFVVERLASSIAGQREFAFKHVLIRDVAYESLPRRLRGQMHVQTAAWIERTSGEGTVERSELLASHYDAAFSYLHEDDLRRQARTHLLAAARQAQARFAISRPSGTSTTWRFTGTRRGRPTARRSPSCPARTPPFRDWPARRPSTASAGSERCSTFRRSTRLVISSSQACWPHPCPVATALCCSSTAASS
jgi:predicted ATPase